MRFGSLVPVVIAASIGASFTGMASAQQPSAAAPLPAITASQGAAPAAGDAALGKKKFYTCYGCHGVENYKNAYPDYSVPELRRQHAAYVISALHEYKGGDRPHATMHAQASSLSDQDMQDIAAYLQGSESVKPTTAIEGKTPAAAATCVTCHGVNGTGVDAPLDPKPPVLAGQHADYLEQALNAYRTGRRKNIVMNGMAQAITNPADVRVLAEYFASQKPALEEPKIHDSAK